MYIRGEKSTEAHRWLFLGASYHLFFFLTLRPYCFFLLIFFPCGPFKKSLLNLLQCFCKRFGLFYSQACEILTTPPGVEPVSPHPCINHWPTREVPILLFGFKCSTCFVPIYFVSVVLQSSLGVFHPPEPWLPAALRWAGGQTKHNKPNFNYPVISSSIQGTEACELDGEKGRRFT